MDKVQELKEYMNHNQLKKVILGGYSKEDVQLKFEMVKAMFENYVKEQEEREAALLADFEKQLKALQDEFESKKRVSDILIVDLNRNINELTEEKQTLTEENQSMELEQFKLQEAYDALTAENQLMVQEQYKMREAYKAYCAEILKKYSESLGTLSGEFTRILENVSNLQKSISEESVIEGLEKALEMMGDK